MKTKKDEYIREYIKATCLDLAFDYELQVIAEALRDNAEELEKDLEYEEEPECQK
jgi:hypothetical protein